jgi:hypothetical protein
VVVAHIDLDEFRADLAALVDKHWAVLSAAVDDDDVDAQLAVAEMGSTFPLGWVFLTAAGSFSDPGAVTMAVRVVPDGQSYFTTVGLLHDSLSTLVSNA